MQPTMMSRPSGARSARERQRLGQSAGLVELDVDRVIAAGEPRERGAVVQRFVGADRHRVGDRARAPRHRPPAAAARSARRRASAQAAMLRSSVVGAPAFVGIDDQARARRRPPHGTDPRGIVLRAELDLEERPAGMRDRGRAHRLRLAERQRIGGDDRAGLGEPASRQAGSPRRLASRSHKAQSSALRAAPGRHGAFCSPARSSPIREGRRIASMAARDALDPLAIARIGHAFAPTERPPSAVRPPRPPPRSSSRARW